MSGAPSSGTSMSGAQSVHFNQYRDASSGGMINGYDSNSFASSSVLNAEDYLDFSGHDSQETDFGQTGQYGNLEGFAPSVQDFASWVPPDLSPYTMFPNNLFSNPPETIFPSMEAYEPRLQADLKPDLASPFINLPSYLSMNVNGDCEPGNSTMPFQPQTNYPSQIPFPCDNWQSPTMVASSNGSTLVDHSPAPPTGHATEGRVSVTQDFPASAIFSDTITHTAHIDPIDGLTERLGEFLFNPTEGAAKAEDGWAKKRKGIKGKVQADAMADDGQSWWIVRNNLESDGLTDSTRNLLYVL
jgi:hypothetical protein